MGVNFYSRYGLVLLGCVEIYIGLFLFTASMFIEKYEIRRYKIPEMRGRFLALPIAVKGLLVTSLSIFVLSLMLLVLYLDLPESESLKRTMTWPLVLLGASAFIYNSLTEGKKAKEDTKNSALIDHLIKNKTFYKNFIGTVFCGIFVIVGYKTIFSN
ncbi:MAG: hypothetical protein H7336_01610 [Bacteriovorax sp.]|nr:hypothetical protein [Bacteriovorax sp.]